MGFRTQHAFSLIAVAALLLTSIAAGARHHHVPRGESGQPGRFDYYLLTLSWSPTYCLIHPDDRSECGGKGYGFVLHGLWPQFDAGGYPEDCQPDAPLTAEAQRAGNTIYPSPLLMRHEWQAHGTCTGLEARDYFQLEDRALGVIRIPPLLESPRILQHLTATQIMSEFRVSNPTLPPDGIVVSCGRGELSEVRICLTRDLRARSCGTGVRSTCPASPVEVPSTR
jgi:ribonuclease T2